MTTALTLRISGTVQGVFFRRSLCEQAHRAGVCGWVRNTDEGAVEAHIEGEDASVQALLRWCEKGPPLARVTGVERSAVPAAGYASFVVCD